MRGTILVRYWKLYVYQLHTNTNSLGGVKVLICRLKRLNKWCAMTWSVSCMATALSTSFDTTFKFEIGRKFWNCSKLFCWCNCLLCWKAGPRSINFLYLPVQNDIKTRLNIRAIKGKMVVWENTSPSNCCFQKFRIKRYLNRPSLDYPLNLTKSTNHKIRKRKWT